MASTPEARRLTEVHRQAQLRLGAQTVQQMRAAWRLVDFDDLDGTVPGWLRVAQPLIDRQHRASTTLAANYYTTFRRLEFDPESRFAPSLAGQLDPQAVITSLNVTGPSTVKRATSQGKSSMSAMSLGEARTSSAAMRHALAGGRNTIIRSIQFDRSALGFARATSGSACAFCAMLASRGPVYSKATVDFETHDGCGCTAEPVYSRNAAWPAGSEDYKTLWDEVASGDPDPLNAFRRALSGAE